MEWPRGGCRLVGQMNTHKPVLTAKARHLCFVLLLCVCLAWGGVLGPCRYSVTKDHLLSLNRLIDNQLDNGCAISYPFTERHSLSKSCYVKATFPYILELLNSHFQYARKSDNRRYVNTLKKMIYNLYSQGCIHEINEELEDNPVRFARVFGSSPKEALKTARSVFQMYMMLMSESLGAVDWSCQEEYAVEETTESTTVVSDTSTTGTSRPSPECQCSCSISAQTTTVSYPAANNVWRRPRQPRPNQQTAGIRPPRSLSPRGAQTNGSIPSVEVSLLDTHHIKKRDTSWLFHPPTVKEHQPLLHKPEWRSRRFPLGNRTQDSLKDKLAQFGADASLYGMMDITQSSDENTKHVLAKRSLDSSNSGPHYTVLQNGASSLKPKAMGKKTESTMDTSYHDTERVPFVAVHPYMMELHSYELKDSSMTEDPKAQTAFPKDINAIQNIIIKDVLPNIEYTVTSRTSLYEGPKEKNVDGTSWEQLSGQPAVFTLAAVSGGFLLFFAFCCFIRKTRCEGLFHCSRLTDKKRVGKDVLLQPCDTIV